MDCGPACLCMIANYYGKHYSLNYFREHSYITREGVSMLGISSAAESIGMRTLCAKITVAQLADEIKLPCILHWDNRHYVVCYKVKGNGDKRTFYISDPEIGKQKYNVKELHKHWLSSKFEGEDVGLAMQIEPGVDLPDVTETDKKNFSMKFFLQYILPHKWQISQLLFGAIVIMIIGYFLPFISQSVVDIGIMQKDIQFIVIMMIVQLVISFSQMSIQFVQSWISLHMNTVINVSLISDYLKKLAKMPLHFFEIRTMGDILQRIGDHGRIKDFLMNDMINIVFSIATFMTFSIVLCVYHWQIFAIYMIGNGLYVIWILSFMKYRRELDNKTFQQSALLQNNMVQFIQGMSEIKLNNIERQKCWEWEHLQANLYKLSRRGLKIGQISSIGSTLFSTTTSILISYISAKMVVSGEMTLGMMTSLSFIIGQVAGPIGSFIGFAQNYQDAKISLERLSDLHTQKDETEGNCTKAKELPPCGDIQISDMSFSYSGGEHDFVLKDISVEIKENEVTAIVGASGCGKTTLLKILQGFYKPIRGKVSVGNISLDQIRPDVWRGNIGAVMQDGYIFSDSISNNIAIYEKIDNKRLHEVARMVNMHEHISSLPHGYDTKIGHDGIALSQGQKQRILLARVIYKHPKYIFLDEATNALDTKNEHEIMLNLQKVFLGRTVVIAAHRLSTIRNANKIIVMDEGRIVEQGNHEKLIGMKGTYYNLIQSQLNVIPE